MSTIGINEIALISAVVNVIGLLGFAWGLGLVALGIVWWKKCRLTR